MSFAEFFTKDGRNIIESLEEEAQEDISLIKQTHDLYSKKVAKVKELVDVWENRRDFVGFDSLLEEIKEVNSAILEKIDKILEFETKEESIVKLLLARIFETGLKVQYDIKHLVGRLKENLRRFHDILINLKFIINKQDEYVKRTWSGAIVLDYEKHGLFYFMLKDDLSLEERLDRFAVEIENEIRFMLGLVTTKPHGSVSFEEVFSPDSNDFLKLYEEIFRETFPDTAEQLSMKELRDNLRWRYERIRKNGEVYHVIILKIGPTPVGASMFGTIRVNKTVCLGAMYYFFLAEKMAEEDLERKGVLSKQLFEVTKQILYRDMQRFGYQEMSAMVADLPPNPKRKTEFHIKNSLFRKVTKGMTKRDVSQYIARYKYSYELLLRLIGIIGFRRADFTYIVSDLNYPSKDVKYLDFYVAPIRRKWKELDRMHSSELLPILKFYVDLGYDLSNERRDLFVAMEEEIVKKVFVKIVPTT